jgi:hypothetical protein
VTQGAVVLTIGAGADDAADFTVLAPSGYSNQVATSTDPAGAGGAAIILGMASKAWSGSGAEDPGVWQTWTSTASGSFAAATVALRPSAPAVSTVSAQSVIPTSATLFGSITNTYGTNATTRGFAISTNSTLSSGVSTTTESGSFSTGSFNVSSTTLAANTTYYYRAWANNSAGTSTGSILNFTTGNSTAARKMQLFGGFMVRLIGNTLKLLQQ